MTSQRQTEPRDKTDTETLCSGDPILWASCLFWDVLMKILHWRTQQLISCRANQPGNQPGYQDYFNHGGKEKHLSEQQVFRLPKSHSGKQSQRLQDEALPIKWSPYWVEQAVLHMLRKWVNMSGVMSVCHLKQQYGLSWTFSLMWTSLVSPLRNKVHSHS